MLRQAAILVGGLGTRLGSKTATVPKPLLPIAGKPFIDHILTELARYGTFEEIVLLAGYLGDDLARAYSGRIVGPAKIKVVVEPAPLGTAGALMHARPALDERLLLMNGDSFLDFNVLDLANAPWPAGTLATMALVSGIGGDRYGRVELVGDRVKAFHPPGTRFDGPINAGIYVLDRAALDLVGTAPASLEADLFPALAARGALGGRIYDRFFIDIGIPVDFDRADRELADRLRRPAVFLDRDGVLNEDKGYVHSAEQFVWIKGAKEAVKLCNDLGYFVFVVSNQAGVARGYYPESAIHRLNGWINAELWKAGAHIDAFEHCPHHPDGTVEEYRRTCSRRKPNPGMITDLLARWPADQSKSFLIGDKDWDLAAARAADIAGYKLDEEALMSFLGRIIRSRQ